MQDVPCSSHEVAELVFQIQFRSAAGLPSASPFSCEVSGTHKLPATPWQKVEYRKCTQLEPHQHRECCAQKQDYGKIRSAILHKRRNQNQLKTVMLV